MGAASGEELHIAPLAHEGRLVLLTCDLLASRDPRLSQRLICIKALTRAPHSRTVSFRLE